MGERLAVDPNDNSILFFGARNGNGLWKSTNSAETWTQVTSFPSVGEPFFPLVPGNPGTLIIYKAITLLTPPIPLVMRAI